MTQPCPQHGYVPNPCPPQPQQCCPPPPAPVCEDPCTCNLVTSNSSTVALSVSGDGSASNAWNISGQVIIDPASTAPVLITPSGIKIDCCPETVTQLVDNGDGTLTYVNELGMPTTIVLGDSDTTYTLVDIGAGNLALNGSDGSMNVVNVCALVAANCSDALVDNGDGSFTHTAVDGTVVTFNVGTDALVDNGDGTYTHTAVDGVVTIIDVCQCGLDGAVVTDNGDGTVNVTDGQGNAITIDVCAAVEAGCTDSLVAETDGSFTHTAVDGTIVVIPAPLPPSTLVDNADGTYTHTSGDGTVTVIDIRDDTDTDTTYDLTDNGDGSIALTGSDGTVDTINVCAIIEGNCSDSLVDNGDGTYTHTAVDGVQVTIDITPSSLVDNGDGTYTHTSGDGVVQVIDTNSSSVVDNGDGTYTHSDGAGNDVVIDPCAAVLAGGCVPTITPNGDATYTFDDGYGNTTIIDINEIDMDINNVSITGSVVTFTAEDGTDTVMDVCQIVGTNCNSSLTVNADGSITHVANNGEITIVPAPVPSVVTPIVTDNPIATHDDGAGTVETIYETVTTLVDNGDDTWTYTSEDGTETIIDASQTSSLVDNADGTITHTGDDGVATIIDICGIVAGNCSDSLIDNGDGSFTHTAIDGAVTIIPAPVPSTVTPIVTDNAIATHDNGDGTVETIYETVTTLVDNGDSTYTYTSEDGTETILGASDSLVDNGDNTYTHTAVDGVVTIIDVCCEYQFSADYAPADGDTPSGSGTAADPFLLPVAQFTYVEYDAAVHGDLTDGTPDVIVGDGTTAAPYQIPICCDTLEILDIVISGTVTNPDGSTTITYTVTEEDDGDANTAVHTFDVVIPAAAELNFEYVTYDEAVHDNGVIEGDGSAASPWQIPVCCDAWVYAEYDPAVHVDGAVPAGSGTLADPFQIPVPIECPIVDYLVDPATGQVIQVTYDGAGGATYADLSGAAWTGAPLSLTCL